MKFDFKITTWERVTVSEEQEEKVLQAIKDGKVRSANDIFNLLADEGDMNVECETLAEADQQLSVAENGYQSTIEVLGGEKEQETIFENTPKQKPLYYVVEKETEDIDGFQECTGNKTITLYLIEANKPVEFATVYSDNQFSTEEAIKEYFEEKDLNLDEYKLEIL